MTEEQKKEFRTHFKKCYDDEFNVYVISPEDLFGYLDNISIPMQAGVIVPKPNTTCEKNVCNNCKHFVEYDSMKDLQNGCINNEVAEIAYVNEPDKFGCTFFEQREA